MSSKLRHPAAGALAVLFTALAATASSADSSRARNYTALSGNGGSPSAYQLPDGSYPTYGDFIEELDGVPCDMNCRANAQKNWSR
jgi:hypothetical protein